MPVAIFPAKAPPDKAPPVKLDAWLNLSHLEKARVLVTVKHSAIAILPLAPIYSFLPFHIYQGCKKKTNIPTSVNQMNSNRKIATTASPTQSKGCEYSAIQKNLLSVALMILPDPSELSKTQCESPLCASTSFHHRSPTRRRPAMFLR